MEALIKQLNESKKEVRFINASQKNFVEVEKVPVIVDELDSTPENRQIVYTDGSYAISEDGTPIAAFALYFPDKFKRFFRIFKPCLFFKRNRIEIFDGPQCSFRAEIKAIHKALILMMESGDNCDIEVRTDCKLAVDCNTFKFFY